MKYIIRNDLTGRIWTALSGEARLYAVGGELDCNYTVFLEGGGATGLTIQDIR